MSTSLAGLAGPQRPQAARAAAVGPAARPGVQPLGARAPAAAATRCPAACRRRSAVVVAAVPAAATPDPTTTPHLQLATARLPADVDRDAFLRSLYQWAGTLTSNGRNLPFALPLDVQPLAAGFKISLLRVVDGGQVLPVADLAATVEAVEGTGNVLMVRLFEGRGAAAVGMGGAPLPPGAGPEAQQKRMKALLAGLVDVQVIMETMKDAIKKAVLVAR